MSAGRTTLTFSVAPLRLTLAPQSAERGHVSTDSRSLPISAGFLVTLIPQASITASFSWAVPFPPEMMAPAMKPTTGFLAFCLYHSAAASREVPRIRPARGSHAGRTVGYSLAVSKVGSMGFGAQVPRMQAPVRDCHRWWPAAPDSCAGPARSWPVSAAGQLPPLTSPFCQG